MKINALQKIEKICREYYPDSPAPLQDFAATLRGRDKEIFCAVLRGERPEGADRTLIRCEQILLLRRKHPENPYGKYHKT